MKHLLKTSIILLTVLISGCSSDDENPDPEETTVDLNEARLNDFVLSEVTYTGIDIEQPEITDGEQATSGTIIITVPETADVLNLSLASVNFDESKFEISPEVGSVQSFETGSVIAYTIKSKVDSEKSISYLVSVIKESTTPGTEELKITGFRFEQSENPTLASTVEAVTILDSPIDGRQTGVIVILVPNETAINDLVPSIDFEGDLLEYKQGTADFTEYPTTDLHVDFMSDYSVTLVDDENELVLLVSNSESSKRYKVIVDVETPIELVANDVTSADVVEGDSRDFVLEFTNKGNHIIETGLEASDYTDNTANSMGNIFSSQLTVSDPIQGSFIRPGEKGYVIIRVNAVGVAIGNYDVSTLFSPTYDIFNTRITDRATSFDGVINIFESISLNVKTTVISSS